jgi:hypothetical protein
MNFHYPNNIEELKDGDKYQKMYPMSKLWGDIKIYNSNMCRTKKESLEHLIHKQRLRIIR